MAGDPVISHNGSELLLKKPSHEQKQFAEEARRRLEATAACEEQQRNFNFVSDSDKKLEMEAFELRDGETLYRPGSPKSRRKRKRGSKAKGKAVKLSYQEDESIDEDVTSIRKEKGLNDMKLKGDMYKKSDLYTGFQHFTDENDTDGKKSKMGASAGSSKGFHSDEDVSKEMSDTVSCEQTQQQPSCGDDFLEHQISSSTKRNFDAFGSDRKYRPYKFRHVGRINRLCAVSKVSNKILDDFVFVLSSWYSMDNE
nr:hypothetical protein [Tanacetum cinerariifolium]